jgi:hypothetical protein
LRKDVNAMRLLSCDRDRVDVVRGIQRQLCVTLVSSLVTQMSLRPPPNPARQGDARAVGGQIEVAEGCSPTCA